MWNSISGYVMIRVDGFSLEKLLNRILQADIPIWNVQRRGAACMTAEIRAKDFLRLRALKHGMRCRIHIVERCGVPFVLARFRFRRILVCGLLGGLLLLAAAQTRIWAIQIDGLYMLSAQVIEHALVEQGISIGMARAAVDPAALSEALRAHDTRIAWVGTHVNGVALEIQIVEADIIPPAPDKSQPAHIVATKDGIVSRITALTGKPMVSPGDAVHAGELLITGDITREGASRQLFVHAEGEVLAEVCYIAEITMPGTQTILERSGNTEPYRALYLAGFSIFESRTRFSMKEIGLDQSAGMHGMVIPLRYETGYFYEMKEVQIPALREDLLAEAVFRAELEALWCVPKDASIVEQHCDAVWNDDGSLTAIASVTVLERIDQISPIVNASQLAQLEH